MSETPIFNASEYQGRLTDAQISGLEKEAEVRGDFQEWEAEMDGSWLADIPEIEHDTIQPPTFEAPTHEELLRQSIEASPKLVLVKDISDVGVALGAVRRSQRTA